MRDHTHASLLSLPAGANNGGDNSARSTLYSQGAMTSEESQLPILENPQPKATALRHHMSDEISDADAYDYNNAVRERENDGPRFRSSARAF